MGARNKVRHLILLTKRPRKGNSEPWYKDPRSVQFLGHDLVLLELIPDLAPDLVFDAASDLASDFVHHLAPELGTPA